MFTGDGSIRTQAALFASHPALECYPGLVRTAERNRAPLHGRSKSPQSAWLVGLTLRGVLYRVPLSGAECGLEAGPRGFNPLSLQPPICQLTNRLHKL